MLGDLCGPITPTTPSGKKLFLLLVDDYNRYMWLVLLSSKDSAPDAIKHVQVEAEVASGKKLKYLQMDHGGEFTSVDFNYHYAESRV